MTEKYLHIVDLDVPYPPNYGAAIDMYCRLKALHKLGIRIILHCFEYGRGKPAKLEEYCEQIYYYSRKNIMQFPFTSQPYIVFSRNNKQLFDRLFADDFPVLLVGEHTCGVLLDERHKQKPFYVRMHNVEHEYYEYLAKATKHSLKKIYYQKESERLKVFEKNLDRAVCLFSVSERDHTNLSAQFSKVVYLPPFIYNDEIDCKPGRGSYVLYHGNLTVEENLRAAEFLINEVCPGLNIPFVIAGTKASSLAAVTKSSNIEFISSPSSFDLRNLITDAQINLLPTFQPTGIKHKLINSLFTGRYCVVNPPMVDGNGLEKFCIVAKDAAEMKHIVTSLFKTPFPQDEIDRRKATLLDIYSNRKNAQKLVDVIFNS